MVFEISYQSLIFHVFWRIFSFVIVIFLCGVGDRKSIDCIPKLEIFFHHVNVHSFSFCGYTFREVLNLPFESSSVDEVFCKVGQKLHTYKSEIYACLDGESEEKSPKFLLTLEASTNAKEINLTLGDVLNITDTENSSQWKWNPLAIMLLVILIVFVVVSSITITILVCLLLRRKRQVASSVEQGGESGEVEERGRVEERDNVDTDAEECTDEDADLGVLTSRTPTAAPVPVPFAAAMVGPVGILRLEKATSASASASASSAPTSGSQLRVVELTQGLTSLTMVSPSVAKSAALTQTSNAVSQRGGGGKGGKVVVVSAGEDGTAGVGTDLDSSSTGVGEDGGLDPMIGVGAGAGANRSVSASTTVVVATRRNIQKRDWSKMSRNYKPPTIKPKKKPNSSPPTTSSSSSSSSTSTSSDSPSQAPISPSSSSATAVAADSTAATTDRSETILVPTSESTPTPARKVQPKQPSNRILTSRSKSRSRIPRNRMSKRFHADPSIFTPFASPPHSPPTSVRNLRRPPLPPPPIPMTEGQGQSMGPMDIQMSMETLYSDGWDTDRKERKLRSQGKSVIEDKLAGGGGGGGSGSSNGNGSGSDASSV